MLTTHSEGKAFQQRGGVGIWAGFRTRRWKVEADEVGRVHRAGTRFEETKPRPYFLDRDGVFEPPPQGRVVQEWKSRIHRANASEPGVDGRDWTHGRAGRGH